MNLPSAKLFAKCVREDEQGVISAKGARALPMLVLSSVSPVLEQIRE